MGQPAARMTDLAGHGGPITYGEPTVLIGFLAAARVGDPFVCPGFDGPKPHVMGNITKGSTSVRIGGAFAARMGDSTGCGVVGVIGKAMPPIMGPSNKALTKKSEESTTGPDEIYTAVRKGSIGKRSGSKIVVEGSDDIENSGGLLWGQAKVYKNESGIRGEAEGAIIHAGGEADTPIGKITISTDIGHAAVKGHYGDNGEEITALGLGGEVTAAKVKIGWETSQENPVYIGTEGEGKLLTAEASFDALGGTDGRRTGVFAGGGAVAAVAKGDISGKGGIKIPIPFTNYSFTLGAKATLGGSVGSVGAAGYGGVYHDKEDGKVHASIGGEVAAALGLKFDLDVMFGLVKDKPENLPDESSNDEDSGDSSGGGGGGIEGVGIPMTPGVIMGGCPTVLIG